MTLLTIIILVLFCCFCLKKYGSLACPAVIFFVGWIFALIGTLIYTSLESVSPIILFYILVGSFLFQLGFKIGISNTRKKEDTTKVLLNINGVYVLTLLFSIPIVIIALKMIGGIRSTGLAQWYSFLISHKAYFVSKELTGYLINLFENYFLSVFAIYWCCEKKHKKICKKLLILMAPLVVVCVLYNPSRNAFLFFFLTCIFIVVYSLKLSNKKILFMGIFALFIFFIYFILISLKKYFYIVDDLSDNSSFAVDQIFSYLSGGISAFSVSASNHSMTAYGSYTFRFFFAIFDKIAGTDTAVDIINEFETSSGVSTNVFTFYDYYLRDFGFLYALFIQFLVGILHGKFYRKYQNGNRYALFISAVLIYPLVMQFFQDQYMSILSSWLQVFIISFIVFKTKIFVKKEFQTIGDTQK